MHIVQFRYYCLARRAANERLASHTLPTVVILYNKAWRSCGTESKIALLSSGYRLRRIRQLPRPRPVFRDLPLKIPYIVSFCCRCFFRDHYEFGTKIGKIQNRSKWRSFFRIASSNNFERWPARAMNLEHPELLYWNITPHCNVYNVVMFTKQNSICHK